ncbi:MAG: aspartate kinase, partial [bacterium]
MVSVRNPWVVLKFGGTSVATAACWQTIASIVRKRCKEGARCLVVCSAIAGISNELELLIAESIEGRHEPVLREIAARHKALATEMGVESREVDLLMEELLRLSTGASLVREASPRLRAQIMAIGELASTRLGAAYLARQGIPTAWRDARELLVSDESRVRSERHRYLSASCSTERDQRLIDEFNALGEKVILTQGFIARNGEGSTVLLGRGGSDVSAAYLAARLGAARCEIWTDVPGMYTANPRQVPQAKLLKALDYDEAQEIASSGAKVLHPRTIAPVRQHGIPLHILSVAHPDAQGTVISADAAKSEGQIKAIAARSGITLISMDTIDMWQQVGFLADVFSCFSRHGLSIDLISTSESNVTVTLDRATNVLDQSKRDALLSELKQFCSVRIVDSCACLSL